MPDIVFIQNLQVETIVGVFDWERTIKQRLRIDLELATDIRKAAETDDLQYALDYNAISQRLCEYIESTEFKLIETLAEKIATLLQEEFAISGLKLTLHKPGAVAQAESVGLVIERGKISEL